MAKLCVCKISSADSYAPSCSTIRLWSLLSGECVHTLYGHDSFVYSLATIPDSLGGGLVSGGEDRTVRVWRASDGECEQTITVPAVSGASINPESGDLSDPDAPVVLQFGAFRSRRTAMLPRARPTGWSGCILGARIALRAQRICR